MLDSDHIWPLRERKRALQRSHGISKKLEQGLIACGTLLVSDVFSCPSCELPDAVARALAYALEDGKTCQVTEAGDDLIQMVRNEVLEKLSQSQLPEAVQVAGSGLMDGCSWTANAESNFCAII